MSIADEIMKKYLEGLCDECKHTREPHEHRCLGNGCKCFRCAESKAFGWVVSQGYPQFIQMTKEQLAEILARYSLNK